MKAHSLTASVVSTHVKPTPEVIEAIERARQRAKLDRRRIKVADQSDAIDWQERHSHTEAVMVKVSSRVDLANGIVTRKVVTQERCRQRKLDARLLDAMDPDQIGAMEAIYAGWRIEHGAIAFGIMSYGERVAKGVSADEGAARYSARMIEQYGAWGMACKANGVHRMAALEIIAYGHSPNAVDIGLKWHKGTAKTNLLNGLELYCRLFRIG